MSFPFRLDVTGAVASVEQNSDAWIEECVAVAMLTRPGEREQVPTFGVADPAFALFQVGSLQRHLLDFGPQITITEVTVEQLVEGRERVVIAWRHTSDEIVSPEDSTA
jgi:phage baseplate assembly protein W